MDQSATGRATAQRLGLKTPPRLANNSGRARMPPPAPALATHAVSFPLHLLVLALRIVMAFASPEKHFFRNMKLRVHS